MRLRNKIKQQPTKGFLLCWLTILTSSFIIPFIFSKLFGRRNANAGTAENRAVMRHYRLTMLKLSITYCSMFLMSLIFAQTDKTFIISGTVISFYTNQPISYGLVQLQKNNKTKSTICDSLGHFVVTGLSKGKYTLSFAIVKGYYYKDTSLSVMTNIDNFKFIPHLACADDFNEKEALNALKSSLPKIMLVSNKVFSDTLPHVIFGNMDTDFQNKYSVIYSDQSVHVGCEECMLPYNLKVFKYLDTKFGTEWRRTVRQDAVGLNEK